MQGVTEYSTHKTATTIFWPCLSGKRPSNLSSCSFFAQKRHPPNPYGHSPTIKPQNERCSWDLSGRGSTRVKDAQGTPTQSHISPHTLVYEDKKVSDCLAHAARRHVADWLQSSQSLSLELNQPVLRVWLTLSRLPESDPHLLFAEVSDGLAHATRSHVTDWLKSSQSVLIDWLKLS